MATMEAALGCQPVVGRYTFILSQMPGTLRAFTMSIFSWARGQDNLCGGPILEQRAYLYDYTAYVQDSQGFRAFRELLTATLAPTLVCA
jgi:hypothetical protein